MKFLKHIRSLNVILYSSIFLVTQITGLLFSLVICFILQDFIWGFVRMALINSFILGIALIGGSILSQRLVVRMKIRYVAAVSSSLILGVSIISLLVILYSEPTLFIYYDRGALAFLFINFLFIIALHAISSGLIFYREIVVQKEKLIGDERHLKDQMEMKLLSSKVNPHFLFNTLNMILNLLKQPAKAEEAILNLSDLLRQNLEQSEKPRISIDQELENVRKYLDIQKVRFGEKLQYEIRGEGTFSIPPLIIQPLVENSIKHNSMGVTSLTITIRFGKNDGRGRVRIVDSEKKVERSMLHKGQGLTITKRRVENCGGTFAILDGGIEMSFSV